MRILTQGEAKATLVDEGAVDEPHSGNEAYGAQHTDGREILHRIHTVVLKNGKGRCIGQCDGRHIECHTQRVEGNEQRLVAQLLSEACLLAHPPAADHEGACHQMTESEQTLRLDVLVGHDTHQRGHENTDYALNGIEP